jgi:hypothetical protein
MWGGQSCPQPDFSRLEPLESGPQAERLSHKQGWW